MIMLAARNLLTLKFSFNNLKESLLFSYPAVPLSITGLLYQSFDKIMLTRFKDLSSIGFYNFEKIC